MTFERPGPAAGEILPELSEDWTTFAQIAAQSPDRVSPQEVFTVADWLATGMTAGVEDPQAAKNELIAVRRKTTEDGAVAVWGFAPSLAAAVLDFYVDLQNGFNPNDVNVEGGRQGRDALAEFAWETGIGRILGPEKK